MAAAVLTGALVVGDADVDHRDRLADNPRMRMILSAERKRSDHQRAADEAVASWVTEELTAGRVLRPADRPREDA